MQESLYKHGASKVLNILVELFSFLDDGDFPLDKMRNNNGADNLNKDNDQRSPRRTH